MELIAYLDKRRKPTLQRWLDDRPQLAGELLSAVLAGEPTVHIYNWLVEYHAFPFKVSAFRNMAEAWKKESRAA